jgi:hypothetical protein
MLPTRQASTVGPHFSHRVISDGSLAWQLNISERGER